MYTGEHSALCQCRFQKHSVARHLSNKNFWMFITPSYLALQTNDNHKRYHPGKLTVAPQGPPKRHCQATEVCDAKQDLSSRSCLGERFSHPGVMKGGHPNCQVTKQAPGARIGNHSGS